MYDPRPLRLLLALAPALLLSACAGPRGAVRETPTDPDAPIRLTLVGLNDFHGAVLDRPVGAADDDPRRGGAAMLSSYLAAIRDENPDGTLLVDAGDMLQGPLLVNHFEGAPVADVYRHLGVAAAALGNHEFDYGPVGPLAAAPPDHERPFGALEEYVERLGVPVLSANLRAAEWATPAGVQAHHVVELAGVRVGLIGLSTETTPTQTLGVNVAGVRFDPVGPAVAEQVAELRADGVEVIVVLAHLDGGCLTDRKWPPPDPCVPVDELEAVLAGAGGEVDAVFLGHRHEWYASTVDGVAVLSAGSRGRALSRVDLYVDPRTRRVDRDRTEVSFPIAACEAVPATGDSCLDPRAEGPWTPASYLGRVMEPDPAVDGILADYVAAVEGLCGEVVTTADAPIHRGGRLESPAGNLVVDAMLAAVPDADVAVLNRGAIRADLAAGPLSYCDLFALFPFDNRFVEVELSGAQLTEVLRVASSGAHAMLYVAGAQLVLERGDGQPRDVDGDGEQERWERDRLIEVRTADGPVDPDGRYTLLLTDYLYGRPDDMRWVFDGLEGIAVHQRLDLVREAVLAAVRAHDGALGADGGWPLPQRDDPRVLLEDRRGGADHL